MLKRAACTLYMAQESDTLGKKLGACEHSVQGKPVIAYIPELDAADFAKTVDLRPLEYVRQRLLHLQASEIVELVDDLPKLRKRFCRTLASIGISSPSSFGPRRDNSWFKRVKEYWSHLCQKLAEAEKIAFDKRARVLKQYHPLGMQMDLQTGVANGVLVVRSPERCASLLRAILTNTAEFDIRAEPGGRTLVERYSNSVFRAVTDNEKLTNSFWNLSGSVRAAREHATCRRSSRDAEMQAHIDKEYPSQTLYTSPPQVLESKGLGS